MKARSPRFCIFAALAALTSSAWAAAPGLMTYHLRRLRLRGLITRRPHTNRYQLTDPGHRAALFYVTSLARVIRPTAANLNDPQSSHRLLRQITTLMTITKT